MAHQLSALVALIETQIQVPAPTWWFTSNHNSTSRESNPPLLTFAMQVKHSCIQNKINQSFFKVVFTSLIAAEGHKLVATWQVQLQLK